MLFLPSLRALISVNYFKHVAVNYNIVPYNEVSGLEVILVSIFVSVPCSFQKLPWDKS